MGLVIRTLLRLWIREYIGLLFGINGKWGSCGCGYCYYGSPYDIWRYVIAGKNMVYQCWRSLWLHFANTWMDIIARTVQHTNTEKKWEIWAKLHSIPWWISRCCWMVEIGDEPVLIAIRVCGLLGFGFGIALGWMKGKVSERLSIWVSSALDLMLFYKDAGLLFFVFVYKCER